MFEISFPSEPGTALREETIVLCSRFVIQDFLAETLKRKTRASLSQMENGRTMSKQKNLQQFRI